MKSVIAPVRMVMTMKIQRIGRPLIEMKPPTTGPLRTAPTNKSVGAQELTHRMGNVPYKAGPEKEPMDQIDMTRFLSLGTQRSVTTLALVEMGPLYDKDG